MSDPKQKTSPAPSGQPSLQQLMSRFLHNQSEAQAAGLTLPDSGEVQPFDAGPVQPIAPKPAWQAALAVFTHLGEEQPALSAPAGWPTVVASQEPHYSLAFCVGNFPQLVRNVVPLLQTQDLQSLPAVNDSAPEVPELTQWANDVVSRNLPGPGNVTSGQAIRGSRQVDFRL